MWHAWQRRELYTAFWWEHLKEITAKEDVGADERIILKWILKKWVASV
jgi:hypothetical protein